MASRKCWGENNPTRRHSFEKVLTGEQPEICVMADGVSIWGLEAKFGHKIVQESIKAWVFFSSSLKHERDVDTLNRSKSPGAAWRGLVEKYTPRTNGPYQRGFNGSSR